MSKYDNYIYLAICEVSLESYKYTNYSTYVEYCKGMCQSLKEFDISKRDRRAVNEIVILLDKIFTMSAEETGQYIGDYFALDSIRHAEFEISVRMTKELFPITGD